MTNPTETAPQEAPPGAALEHLAHLRKMSATAGVALGDYRSISAAAVTALVLGVASWMSLLHPILYLVPVGAVGLGIVALLQIRRSSGTQVGAALAGLGVVLGLALGGWGLVSDLGARSRVERHRSEISRMITDFGTALSTEDYEAAYQFTSENFRAEVPIDRFRQEMGLEAERLGGIKSAATNDLARVTQDATGLATAQAMMVVEIGFPEPLRQQVNLIHEENQ